MFRNERNAYITGFSLFMFLVLRRLIDIQMKLHEVRLRMCVFCSFRSSGSLSFLSLLHA